MTTPTRDFTHLWNDLPFEERARMMPYMIESHKLQVWQAKQTAILAHEGHMRALDAKLASLGRELDKLRAEK